MLRVSSVTLLLAALLGGCATPEALRGDYPEITPAQAAASGTASTGTIRWGGPILSMNNTGDSTCFEILSRPLDAQGRPRHVDRDQGRFLACYAGFKDPEVYKPGRDVTVIGTLAGTEQRKVGEFDYTYPKVAASAVHLWKQETTGSSTTYLIDPFFYGPYGYPYYYRVYYVAPPQPPADPVAPQSPQRSVPATPLPDLGSPLQKTPLGGNLGGLR